MSQLDAVYGEKEARTFATNHGLQILYAPREQRDADEYSAMLGNFTERATSRGRSRSFGAHGSHSVSRNDSDQRRPLLLPQEFKELGSERFVAIVENCKPILGDKIRYYRDKVFLARLRRPPPVPRMNMDRHLAVTQQRWRYAEDEVNEHAKFEVEDLAHDLSGLPQVAADASVADLGAVADAFFEMTKLETANPGGGSVQAIVQSTELPDLEALSAPVAEATTQP
jgi:type IV secretion system protein VirD4